MHKETPNFSISQCRLREDSLGKRVREKRLSFSQEPLDWSKEDIDEATDYDFENH